MAIDFDKRKAAALIAVALAGPCEGLRNWAYRDSTGLPTICMGSTSGVQMGDFRTTEQCKAMLTKEMSDVIKAVDQCRPGLPTPILAAAADLAYNAGNSTACDSTRSTFARKLAAADYLGACAELPKWNKAKVGGVLVPLPGLTKRRNLEYALCMTGVAS